VRIGDQRMQRLTTRREGYFELPFMNEYSPELDAFFIFRSVFMIGSQSGPCAYARAFGRPILSVNAVYHYTLLPSVQELACFKHYLSKDQQGTQEFTPEEILLLRLFHLDNSYQFDSAGIDLRSASSAEILAATQLMAAWCQNPDQLETAEQRTFRELSEHAGLKLSEASDLQPPVGDFLGFSLPNYRIAPRSVEISRLKPIEKADFQDGPSGVASARQSVHDGKPNSEVLRVAASAALLSR
jgi:putative glycosyltransferase (TIGR04372 family)